MGSRWCQKCQSQVPDLKGLICETCGIPVKQNQTCEKCKSNPPTYRMMRSWAVFDKPVQNALHTLKYRHNIGIGDALAVQMKEFVESLNWDVDLLVPVPLGEKRLKRERV